MWEGMWAGIFVVGALMFVFVYYWKRFWDMQESSKEKRGEKELKDEDFMGLG